MTVRPTTRNPSGKGSHLELPLDGSLDNWNIHDQHVRTREESHPEASPALSTHWTLTAASGDDQFPFIMYGAKSGRYYSQHDPTPTIILTLEKRGKSTGKTELKETAPGIHVLERVQQQATKTKQVVGQILSHLTPRYTAKEPMHSTSHLDFRFTTSPATAHANKLRRRFPTHSKMQSKDLPQLLVSHPHAKMQAPVPTTLPTSHTSHLTAYTWQILPTGLPQTVPQSTRMPSYTHFPKTPFSSLPSGAPVPF